MLYTYLRTQRPTSVPKVDVWDDISSVSWNFPFIKCMMCHDIVFKRPLFVSVKTASSVNNILKKTQRAMNNTSFLLFF